MKECAGRLQREVAQGASLGDLKSRVSELARKAGIQPFSPATLDDPSAGLEEVLNHLETRRERFCKSRKL
jgi:hypothetical protein